MRFNAPRATAGLTVALLLTLIVAGAQAAPNAVGGLNALVKSTGAEQTVQLRFPIAADDTGAYTYNVTIDATGPVVFPDVETAFGAVRANSLITFDVTFSGATAALDFFVNAYDGVSNGTASCTVTVDTADLYAYSACGDMDPAYVANYCLTQDADNDFGFNTAHQLFTFGESGGGVAGFRVAAGGTVSGYGGLNLGGAGEYNYTYQTRAIVDGGTSKALLFYSAVDVDASASSVADAATVVGSSFTVPNEGAFRDGYGVVFVEDGSNFDSYLFYNADGATTFLLNGESWSSGVSANQPNDGYFSVSPYRGVIESVMGAEVARFAYTDAPAYDDLYSFWVVEYGTGAFNVASHAQGAEDPYGCLTSLPAALGGASAATGAPSQSQGLEDFTGEGGYGGTPMYPFTNTTNAQEGLGIDITFFAWLLFGLTAAVLGLIGAYIGGGLGAGSGVALAGVLGYQWNILPGYALVLAVLLAAAIIAFGGRRP